MNLKLLLTRHFSRNILSQFKSPAGHWVNLYFGNKRSRVETRVDVSTKIYHQPTDNRNWERHSALSAVVKG